MSKNHTMIEDGYVADLILCFNCGKRCERKTARNGLYCKKCWTRYAGRLRSGMKHSLKCEIPGCTNRTDQGNFVGGFCVPCHSYIVGKSAGSEFNSSRSYKNELVKNNLRLISAMEKRRLAVEDIANCGRSSAHRVHKTLEDVRLLMTAVLNNNIDLMEMWNADLFVARKHAFKEQVHHQDFGGPLPNLTWWSRTPRNTAQFKRRH